MVIKWLRTLLSSSKKLIGTDQFGNKYYEAAKASGAIQRSVENDVKPEDFISGQLPLEWEAWIRMKRQTPPTIQEIEQRMKYTETVLRRATIKQKEDDENQKQAYADGLIARERTLEKTPGQQALLTNTHSSSGGIYQPEAWAPGGSSNVENEVDAWKPGGS